MSIVRCNSKRCGSYGWQARAHVAPGERLTAYFADEAHGGEKRARLLAQAAQTALQRAAKRIRRERSPR